VSSVTIFVVWCLYCSIVMQIEKTKGIAISVFPSTPTPCLIALLGLLVVFESRSSYSQVCQPVLAVHEAAC